MGAGLEAGAGAGGVGDGVGAAVEGVVVVVELSRLPGKAVREMRGHCCFVKL